MSRPSSFRVFRILACCVCSVTLGIAAYAASPSIISFAPTSGPVGTVLTITVANYTPESAVQLNGTAAAVNNVTLTAVVAPGTTTGPLSVTTPNGTAVSTTNFTVLPTSVTTDAHADALVAVVGDRHITEKDVVNELKHQGGDQVLMQMINDELISKYARQKGVAATDAELEQFIKFQQATFEMQGRTIDSWLESRGQTMAEFRKLLQLTILQIKLIVPQDDIKAALAKYGDKFSLPKRYRIRDFSFSSKEKANKALVTLKKPDSLQKGAAMATNATTALLVHTISVKDFGTRSAAEAAALKLLKPGGFSVPIALKTGGCHVLQLVEVVPEEPATLKNRSIVVAQQLVSGERQKYEGKIDELKADALAKIDTQILSGDYPKASQALQEMRLHNSAVNGTPSAPQAMFGPPPAGH